MSDLVKEGREKLEGVSELYHQPSNRNCLGRVVVFDLHVEGYERVLCVGAKAEIDAKFIAWSRNNMAALLDQIEAKNGEMEVQNEYVKTCHTMISQYFDERDDLKVRNELLERALTEIINTAQDDPSNECDYERRTALQALKKSE